MNTPPITRDQLVRAILFLEHLRHVRASQVEYRRTISAGLRHALPGLEAQLDAEADQLHAELSEVLAEFDALTERIYALASGTGGVA